MIDVTDAILTEALDAMGVPRELHYAVEPYLARYAEVQVQLLDDPDNAWLTLERDALGEHLRLMGYYLGRAADA